MRYSLADYILTIKSNNSEINNIIGNVSIGGEGSAIGSINISYSDSLWTTTGYKTGGYVHDKNLSRVGTISIALNQLSDKITKFIQLCNVCYSGNDDSLTLTVTDNNSNQIIATGNDCYISKIADQVLGATAADQTWEFTCGKIVID